MENLTPMLSQYRAIKREHEDVILLFRLGDFYEMFGDDAKVAADALDLVLTSRDVGKGRRLPMCGIPYHAADRYLARLLAAGHKAAICEQVEDAKKARGLVKREVIRILTPGTVVEDHLLEEGSNNYLVSVTSSDDHLGLAAADCSTGEMILTEFHGSDPWGELSDEIARLQPAEVLAAEGSEVWDAVTRLLDGAKTTVTTWGQEAFLAEAPAELLRRHFGVVSLRGYGCEDMSAAVDAGAAIIAYLRRTHKSALEQIREMRTYSRSQFMVVDATTRRNLELLACLSDGSRRHTLLWVLDDTLTPMGARLLRRWITSPLIERQKIEDRLDAVEELIEDATLRGELRDELRKVRDLERPLARAAAGTASPRDLGGLRGSLERLPSFGEMLSQSGVPSLDELLEGFDPLDDLCDLLMRAVDEAPPATIREGGVIRPGYSRELDELRDVRTKGKEWIAHLQERERERTGIKSLKVGFNQVFGYYIEVTRPNLHLAPDDYQRRQTMRNSERFITPELKEYESKVLGAEERILALEQELFADLRSKVTAEAVRLQRTSAVVARIDVLASFAEVASRNGYARPEMTTDDRIDIKGGRHPVVELALRDERFVPNDTHIDCSDEQLLIITGPNMAGKSTYLRQVALITLMAQIGSFVPAERATIGIVDRIFSRVGASDDLATGQSTFMVEMTETANILRHATKRSLIILDEIGRGTSTFDGLSIAWSVAEYIHNSPRLGAKALFATHYHHLNELAESLPRVRNYRVAVKEQGDQVVFLRRIVPGGTDRSYGIQVARLAGMPPEVIERAKQVLWSLEQQSHVAGGAVGPRKNDSGIQRAASTDQLALFAGKRNPVMEEIRQMSLNDMTPLEALNALSELQRKARAEPSEDAPSGRDEEE